MRKIDRIVEELKSYFLKKSVLEVACGDAVFSLAVSRYAKSVCGIDTSLARVAKRNLHEVPDNVCFQKTDATQLDFEPESFDVVVSYNAIGHLAGVLKDCISEMVRVLKGGGCLVFIATWRMDRTLISIIQDIIATMNTIQIAREIKNKIYYALIWKKI